MTAAVPSAPGAPLLKAQGLVKHFYSKAFLRKAQTVHVVNGVDFEIGAGETLGLVGESGCGKSTVGKLVAGLIEPTAGEVTIDGARINALSPAEWHRRRRDVQLVFQDPFASLNPRMSAGTIIAEPMANYGASAAERERAVAALLPQVGLPVASAAKYPHEFSGGQRQRIGIARALALKPKLIICDEPVSALDVSVQAQIINLLIALQRDTGVSYLFIAHDLAVVRHISHQVAVMYLGKIVETASRDALFAAPKHPYTRALLGAVPKPVPGRRKRQLLSGELPSLTKLPSGCAFRTRCPLATELCAAQEPPLDVKAPGHRAACHYA